MAGELIKRAALLACSSQECAERWVQPWWGSGWRRVHDDQSVELETDRRGPIPEQFYQGIFCYKLNIKTKIGSMFDNDDDINYLTASMVLSFNLSRCPAGGMSLFKM